MSELLAHYDLGAYCFVDEYGRRWVVGAKQVVEVVYRPEYVHGWRGSEGIITNQLRHGWINLTIHPPHVKRDLRWPWNKDPERYST